MMIINLPVLSETKFPHMRCDDNCGECCGPVACIPSEYRALEQYVQQHAIAPLKQGVRCPWFQKGQCAVYDVRPFMCRFFGHAPHLPCPRDYNVNVPQKRVAKLNDLYNRHHQAEGREERWLHEVVYTIDELRQEIERDLQRLGASAIAAKVSARHILHQR